MKVARLEHLHADAGKGALDFLKITTDDGIVGWSEYNETFGGLGVSAAIDGLVPFVIGRDPRTREAIVTTLYAVRRQAPGGVIQQAIAAIENALLDVQARALGIPVYELLGGPQRERLRLYWSHCGYFRLFAAAQMQIPPLRDLDGVVAQGKEVVARGFTALKANIFLFDDGPPRPHMPGFARPSPHAPSLNAERRIIRALRDELAAFREGAGRDVDILVDLNFNFRTEGFVEVARALEPFDLFWVEIDSFDPAALQYIRSRIDIPVASLESQYTWYDELVTTVPKIVNGHLVLPTGPGWGTEVNEAAVKAHPPRRRA
ncbi:MAG: hypothetical protein DME02_22270 [Candidatus Rokuibacteriota bacterium]|nr:MAG: hypothetical protein DME02_22270 [Candidatus Rokubacteria bacterium]